MRAIAIDEFGGSDLLAVRDLPAPEADSGEVLIRVRAAGVGPWDAMSRQGGFGQVGFPFIPGFEAAGIVERAGDGVSNLAEGEEVYAYRPPGGCYAEYLAASEGVVARKPAALSFTEAAAVPVAGTTAHQGLFDELDLREGETVLVTAAAGGVGTFAVQLAAGLGARVVATARRTNHDYLRGLGATDTIDYTEGDWVETVREAHPAGVDAVLECVGGENLARSFGAVRDGGRVSYIVPAGEEPEPPRGITAGFFSATPDGSRLARLGEMFDARRLSVRLEDVLSLSEASQAHDRVEDGHVRGKIVLSVE